MKTESFLHMTGYTLLLFGVESKVISITEAAEMSGKTVEELQHIRTELLASVKESYDEEVARMKRRKKLPRCTLVDVVGKVAWVDVDDLPILRLRVVSLSEKPCAGCGGRAGTVEVLSGGDPSFSGRDGEMIGPGLCIDKLLFEDDPAAARAIAEIKVKLNPETN